MRLLALSGMVCMLVGLSVETTRAADEETQKIEAQNLTLEIPKSWKKTKVSNNLRLAQFEIAPAEGDSEPGELVVFPPFGGTVSQNVKRWVGQFQPEGRTATMKQGTVPQGKYVLVDLAGTFNKPDGPPFLRKTKPAPNYRMIAVMLMTEKDGSYFLKLTGPEKTIAGAVDAFRKSFGADESKEENYAF